MNQHLVLILSQNRPNRIIDLEDSLSKNKINYMTVCDSLSIDQDQELLNLGFFNLTRSPYIKKPSAWDKAFYLIEKNNLCDRYDYFFFVEDDVYSKNYEYINKFIQDCINNFDVDFITKQIRPRSHYPTWQHWKENYITQFKYPSQSFNPLCRISKRLTNLILEYRKFHNRFEFHEILIASINMENNLDYINYIENDILKQYIGAIKYNPILLSEEIIDERIYHPVKESKDAREKGLSCC